MTSPSLGGPLWRGDGAAVAASPLWGGGGPRQGERHTRRLKPHSGLCLVRGGGGQGGFLVRSLVDGAGSYSVAHRAGLLPTELTGTWG